MSLRALIFYLRFKAPDVDAKKLAAPTRPELSTQKYLKAPRVTSKYLEVPPNTKNYLKVLRSTPKYFKKYLKVLRSIQKYLKVGR